MYAPANGKQPFEDGITCHMATAHPLNDVRNNRAYNVGVRWGKQPVYVIYSTPLDAAAAVQQLQAPPAADPPPITRTLVCEVPTQRPCYMHSFAMSSSYIILTESPIHIDLLRMLAAPFTGASLPPPLSPPLSPSPSPPQPPAPSLN